MLVRAKNSSTGLENPIRILAGQYFDQETGLHYNYHRYYDPQLGRYLRTDPIGLAGGINPYIYVQNNPLNLVDFFGLLESDVKDIWNDILNRYKGEIEPRGRYYFDENISMGYGGTAAWSGNVYISDEYRCKELSQDEFVELYGVLLHEMMHSTDPWWRVKLDSGDGPLTDHHRGIYQRQPYEMGERVRFNLEKAIESGEMVPKYKLWGLKNDEVLLNSDGRNPNNIEVDVINLYKRTRQ